VAETRLAPLHRDRQLARDAARPPGEPLQFAETRDVSVTPDNDGHWQLLAGGTRVWRYRLRVPGATDLSLGFTRFQLTEGARLYLFDTVEGQRQGPFTALDNQPHEQFWPPMLGGETVTLELSLPAGAAMPTLRLGRIGAGYRDLLRRGPQPRQGACNIDVVCPEAALWQDTSRSVAALTFGGFRFCSGTLINDVPASGRGFFLTAHHCGIDDRNASSVTLYWNFHSPVCGQLGGGLSGADVQVGGARVRASRADVDMTLLELNTLPDPAWGVVHAGWDRSGQAPLGSVAIHHPGGDEKAISFNDDRLTVRGNCIGVESPLDSHWRVDNWEQGTTEPGSSGSGLFEPVGQRLVGFLSGGTAACGFRTGYDCYGRFSVAWDGPDAGSRLRDWLDPAGTGAVTVNPIRARGGNHPGFILRNGFE